MLDIKNEDDLQFLKGTLLQGKKGLIMGVANDRSLGYGLAAAAQAQGADLAFTYQGEVLKKRVEPLASALKSNLLIECDVTNLASIDRAFDYISEQWSELDFIVHSIGFSDKNELKGRYVDTSLENFLNTMNISCYSFTAVAKRAEPLMKKGGSLITLTYYGAEKAMPNYNVMGVAKAALEASVRYLAMDLGPKNIRVNAISAGPVRTLAASAIGDFKEFLKWGADNSPLKRNVSLFDVGNAGIYLASDLSSGVTGEVLHVDGGYHAMGMKMPQSSE